MTAYLRRGDRIMLAAPDFQPRRSASEDMGMWKAIYDLIGVTVEHVDVHHGLTHPVVVAVLRDDDNPVEGDPA